MAKKSGSTGSSSDPFLGAKPSQVVIPQPRSLLTIPDSDRIGLEVNNPAGLPSIGVGAGEYAQGLPPYARIQGYRVDDIPSAPREWQRSGDLRGIPTASYVVGFRRESGLWFDLNALTRLDRDYAVIPSSQGVNGITVEPIGPELVLEKFPGATGDNPPQNYMATTGTPEGLFWIDGFRGTDGTVRQFVLTEDVSRGVAAQLIGEARTHSFGFAIFQSVKPRTPRPTFRRGFGALPPIVAEAQSFGATRGGGVRTLSAAAPEVGAGAKIRQRIFPDPQDLSYWQPRPVGIIVLHYLWVDELQKLLGAVRTAGRSGEGPLQGLKVGN